MSKLNISLALEEVSKSLEGGNIKEYQEFVFGDEEEEAIPGKNRK